MFYETFVFLDMVLDLNNIELFGVTAGVMNAITNVFLKLISSLNCEENGKRSETAKQNWDQYCHSYCVIIHDSVHITHQGFFKCLHISESHFKIRQMFLFMLS